MTTNTTSRRTVLKGAALAAASGFIPTRFAIGASAPIKLGLMLPFSGTYAGLGNNIADALKLRIAEAGGSIGGRAVEFVMLDDESAPPKAKDNAMKLIAKDKVDFLIGTVHSGVAEAMAQVARDEDTLVICPNAGSSKLTGAMCSPNIFRTSFTLWQCAYPCGSVMLKDGHRRAVVMTWNYPGGLESAAGFKEAFTAGGGTVVKELLPDFPNVEFQAYLTEIAALKPDAVFTFFAGGGALKFMKDYAAAGLKNIPLYGSGFLTDGVYKKAGDAAAGIKTTLHYADELDNPVNKAFRAAFQQATSREADVYAVQGYDTGTLLIKGLEAVKGDTKARKALVAAMETARIDSPRGAFTLSKAHNPVQDIYLREVKGGSEAVLGVAHAALADPATGCKM
jgi:branched-chain amino acid transport system substrate-binding protein